MYAHLTPVTFWGLTRPTSNTRWAWPAAPSRLGPRDPIADRSGIFLRFHGLLLARQNEILDLIQLETGKARRYAFEEILDTAIVTRYYALRAGKYLRLQR
jgi:acyl-CoA reductase-like NAD-dependent aldehyde dehydrogenase